MDFIRNAKEGQFHVTIIDVNASTSGDPLEAPPHAFISMESLSYIARATAKGGLAVINVICSDNKLFETIISV